MIIKTTKSGKARCPVCNKLVKLYKDEKKNLMVLECCKKYSLFDKGKK
jgi:hypothetical protein